MRAQAFEAFAEASVATYADDNIRAGRWPSEVALERARNEFNRLLPQGLETPDHFIFEIEDEAYPRPVGFLWFAIVENNGGRWGYIYHVRIHPEFRGRGHARAALAHIERFALDKGVTTMGLHVFSFNTGAQALYRSIGYGITGMNMLKPLQRGDGGARLDP